MAETDASSGTSFNASRIVACRGVGWAHTLYESPTGDGDQAMLVMYAQPSNQIGSTTRQSEIRADAQKTFLEQSRASQQSFSGVNLDEEAANLIRYQQAYQASARLIQIGSSLFQDLLDVVG